MRQLTAAVRWSESVAAMLQEGATRFVEIGPGSVLCGLHKRIGRGAPCHHVGTPADIEKWTLAPHP